MSEEEVKAVARALRKVESETLDVGGISLAAYERDARAAIAALDKLRGWRPIGTAPTRGYVLLVNADDEMAVCVGGRKVGWFVEPSADNAPVQQFRGAIAWMPPPNPPEAAE